MNRDLIRAVCFVAEINRVRNAGEPITDDVADKCWADAGRVAEWAEQAEMREREKKV